MNQIFNKVKDPRSMVKGDTLIKKVKQDKEL